MTGDGTTPRPARAGRYRYVADSEALLSRMKRIEGQATGIRRMIEEERYCIDIVQQLSALSAAVDEVALRILERHVEGCVADAIRADQSEDHIRELIQTVRKVMRR